MWEEIYKDTNATWLKPPSISPTDPVRATESVITFLTNSWIYKIMKQIYVL